MKTRLHRVLGEELSLHLYHQLLGKTHALARRVKARVFFYRSGSSQGWPFRSFGFFNRWRIQKGRDLGQRMCLAFQDAFRSGITRAVLIGSDCPYLKVRDIRSAFQTLNEVPVVIGPSADGGYYLIGLRAPLNRKSHGNWKTLFQGIPWSRPRVFDKTFERIRKVSLQAGVLKTYRDLDRGRDLDSGMFDELYPVDCVF